MFKLYGEPVIHARTFSVDFRPKLLIRPGSFSDEDSDYAYQVAINSTVFREMAPRGGRTVFYAKGNYVVFGKTVVFEDLFQSCESQPRFTRVDRENGRLAYGFIGAAFPRERVKNYDRFRITDKELLRIYITAIASRWEETYSSNDAYNSKLSEPMEIEVQELKAWSKELWDKCLNIDRATVIEEDTIENQEALLSCCSALAIEGRDVSLCTSLDTDKAIRESCFSVVTCKNAQSVRLRIAEYEEGKQQNIKTEEKGNKQFIGNKANAGSGEVQLGDAEAKRNPSIFSKKINIKSEGKKPDERAGGEQSLDDLLRSADPPSEKNILKYGSIAGALASAAALAGEIVTEAKPQAIALTAAIGTAFAAIGTITNFDKKNKDK